MYIYIGLTDEWLEPITSYVRICTQLKGNCGGFFIFLFMAFLDRCWPVDTVKFFLVSLGFPELWEHTLHPHILLGQGLLMTSKVGCINCVGLVVWVQCHLSKKFFKVSTGQHLSKNAINKKIKKPPQLRSTLKSKESVNHTMYIILFPHTHQYLSHKNFHWIQSQVKLARPFLHSPLLPQLTESHLLMSTPQRSPVYPASHTHSNEAIPSTHSPLAHSTPMQSSISTSQNSPV